MFNNLQLSFGNSSVVLKLADFNSGLLANADLTGLATVSLTESWPNEIVSFPTIWRDSKTNTVVRVCLPTSFLRGAWRSKRPVAFLSEVANCYLRLGLKANHVTVDLALTNTRLSGIAGRWHGWRAASRSSAARSGGFADDGTVLSETLDSLSTSMSNYADWICRSLPIKQSIRILEIGAGTGTITERLASSSKIVACEPSAHAREVLHRIAARNNNIQVTSTVEESSKLGPFDLIVLVNVLEHILFDVEMLEDASRQLVPGGSIAIFSPAHNVLYSKFDASIGHVRRYSKWQLRETMKLAGLQPTEVRYFNPLGAILWLFVNRFFGKTNTDERSIGLYDKFIVPIAQLLDAVRFRPFGQSIIGVAKNIKQI
jgi:SAM-dependent methyltransferase